MTLGKPVFLHKYTGWPRTGFVREIFPDARFINVTRDGRAVVASALRTSWWKGHLGPEAWQWGPLPPAYAADWEASGRSFPVLAAQCWKILMDAFMDARELVPADQWMDVRFEDVSFSYANLGVEEALSDDDATLSEARAAHEAVLEGMNLEVAPGERKTVEALVRREMAGAYPLRAPLDVSVGDGADWESAAH